MNNHELTEQDWEHAKEHLDEMRKLYTEIGMSGVPALFLIFTPLLKRYEQGERTHVLYNEIMSTN